MFEIGCKVRYDYYQGRKIDPDWDPTSGKAPNFKGCFYLEPKTLLQIASGPVVSNDIEYYNVSDGEDMFWIEKKYLTALTVK